MNHPPRGTDLAQAAHAQHVAAWNQIPWLVNGSASVAQRAAFERHAQACEDCRAELGFQQRLQSALRSDALPAHSPEPALGRLQARIAIAESVAERAMPAHTAAAGWRQSGIWTRAWAGVALLQALGIVLLLSMGIGPGTRNDGEYRTLTTAPSAAAAAASVRLVPAPQMAAALWPALLQRHGLVALEVGRDGASLGVARRDGGKPDAALLAALRAEPLLILVEPIGAAGPTGR